ncbi:ras GTPase-activating protein 4 isoform X4 [Columba livia]|uniref:ras GTPase-activating protein 4 isoform X4 n=1 Tax=Columba livia TaxID=8932 RepID=UPI0031BB0041
MGAGLGGLRFEAQRLRSVSSPVSPPAMARRSALSIRIVEGRNLPAKDITGSSDPYCIVKIDDEAIIRTATVWKTLSPFWGEEYEVHLQPTFHSVSIYVMDEDALSRDDVIGKVYITRDMLVEHPEGYSGWVSLSEVDPDEEVQGEIHLRVEVQGSQGGRRLLRCTVLEARDLARKDRNGASDPFVRLRYNGKAQESAVVKKSCYPRWNETFEFELAEPTEEKLCVEVWDWDLVGRNDFLGKVVFSVQGLEATGQEEGWFRLRPDKSKPRADELSLALESPFAWRSTSSIHSFMHPPRAPAGAEAAWARCSCRTARFTWSPSWMKPPQPSAGRRSPSTWSNSSWAKGWSRSTWTYSLSWSWPSPVSPTLCSGATPWPLNRWSHSSRCCADQNLLLQGHPDSGLSPTGLVAQGERWWGFIFPWGWGVGENPLSRSLGVFGAKPVAVSPVTVPRQVTGMPYLHAVLGPTITRVFEEKKYVELDPGKVEIKDVGCSGLHRVQTEGEVIEQGRQHLQSYLGELLDAIGRSAPACPLIIRAVFRQLFHRVGERFPQHQHTKFVAVTSFLCLRFFSPAIMTPKLFHLRETHADARTSRTLLLLAKAVQLVGNMEPAAGRAKETWLAPLLPALQQGIALMKDFITRLVGTEREEEEEGEGQPPGPPTMVVKEGLLFVHKTRGKGPVLATTAKKLHFCLSGDTLSFSKSPSAERSGAIALGDILAAEKVEEKSFGSAHVMQVVYVDSGGQQETAYLQCKCVNELNQWLSALRKVCVNNPRVLRTYHPGVFRGDKWSCCHQRERTGME